MERRIIFTALFLILTPLIYLQGAGKNIRISRDGLHEVIGKGTVLKLILKTGNFIQGQAIEASPTTLRLLVRKGSAAGISKGETVLELSRIASLTKVEKRGNKRFKLSLILGGTVGVLAFVAAGASEEYQSKYFPVAAGLTGGLIAGGYVLGKSLDIEETTYLLE